MTESEWLSGTTPIQFLEHLRRSRKSSDRKLRLFTVACCRRVERWLLAKDQKDALNALERHADGIAMTDDLKIMRRNLHVVYLIDEELGYDTRTQETAFCARSALAQAIQIAQSQITRVADQQPLYETIRFTAQTAGCAAIILDEQNGRTIPAQLAEHQALAAIVRDIFGNPFRPITINSSWLTSRVLALASGIYEEKAFDRMPILADALQDADCDNEEVLQHCRQAEEHVRGCWVLDSLTSRK
jgi:hypothetical protein